MGGSTAPELDFFGRFRGGRFDFSFSRESGLLPFSVTLPFRLPRGGFLFVFAPDAVAGAEVVEAKVDAWMTVGAPVLPPFTTVGAETRTSILSGEGVGVLL